MSKRVLMKLSLILVAVISVCLFGVCSCGSGSDTSGKTNAADAIKIVSSSPAAGTSLRVGNTYTFEITVEYTLKEDNGNITLVIQRGDSVASPLANVVRSIKKGSGKVSLKSTIVIPNTSSIQVFVPMAPQGATTTSVVDSREYTVTGK